MITGIVVYLEDLELFDETLDDADIGKIVRSLAQYVKNGEEVKDLSPVGKIAYKIMKGKVDREVASYNKKVAGGQQGGRPRKDEKPKDISEDEKKPKDILENHRFSEKTLGGQKEKEYETEAENEREKEQGFIPPTQDQIRGYIAKHRLTVDPVAFWTYYKARDWMMGKARMQDWEAAIESWQTREGSKAAGKPNLRVLSAYCEGQRDLTEDDMRGTTEDDILNAIMEQRKKVNG